MRKTIAGIVVATAALFTLTAPVVNATIHTASHSVKADSDEPTKSEPTKGEPTKSEPTKDDPSDPTKDPSDPTKDPSEPSEPTKPEKPAKPEPLPAPKWDTPVKVGTFHPDQSGPGIDPVDGVVCTTGYDVDPRCLDTPIVADTAR